MALSIFIVMVIPFSLIAQFNIGGDYKELIWNVIFYIALLLFGVLYCFIIQAKTAEKLFVFFVVMSYGFFVTSTVTFCTVLSGSHPIILCIRPLHWLSHLS